MIKLKNLIYVICFTFFSFSSFSFEKSSDFSLNEFDKLNNQGKIIVINSWNEWCSVCATQTSIFEQAKKDFPDYEFFFYEHDKNKNISEKLNIKFWTTIAIYKDGKEVAREIGLDKKEEIYELLKKGI